MPTPALLDLSFGFPGTGCCRLCRFCVEEPDHRVITLSQFDIRGADVEGNPGTGFLIHLLSVQVFLIVFDGLRPESPGLEFFSDRKVLRPPGGFRSGDECLFDEQGDKHTKNHQGKKRQSDDKESQFGAYARRGYFGQSSCFLPAAGGRQFGISRIVAILFFG